MNSSTQEVINYLSNMNCIIDLMNILSSENNWKCCDIENVEQSACIFDSTPP